tara:strand:- start:246 stop:821 length:576 start_codon:yes stop_codon:yes gene_type:complete
LLSKTFSKNGLNNMNRRDFIKASVPAAVIPAIAITCKYEDDEKGPEKESTWKRWDYRVYCYERKQGEWTFSQNIRGSFAYQREYMTFDEDNDLTWNGYAGWMDGGKLHFASFDDATDFVDCHVRTKDDINLIDSIYDIYFVSRRDPEREVEIKVAHHWYNGDTGRTIMWEQDGFNRKTGEGLTDWSKVESA